MSTEQILGLITGLAFGFLLQRGRVLRYDKQVAAMLFKDMAIFKFMLSAIVIGMFGILALNDLEVIKLSHKAMNVGGILIGGTLFGIGWAVMGARLADGCPSGHGLSGMMQLSVSSFVALAFFFGIGAIIANLMYRKVQ